jgi:F-type H+-transporting ATPase subunit delta
VPSQSNDAGGVAGRYASALYELADQAKCLDAVADDLRALRGLVEENEDVARVVASPVLSRDAQVAAMTELGEKAGFQDLTVKFLGLLARNRRLAALRPAVGAFLAELASRRGEITAEVTSAQPLNDGHLESIKSALAQALGSKVALDSRVDPALIGGMVVRVGSKMIDSSLATKLQKLRLSMKGIG